jgi:HK97 family phage portal protein
VALISGGVLTAPTPSPSEYSDSGNGPLGTRVTAPVGAGLSLLHSHATFDAVYRSQVWVATLTNKLAGAQSRLPVRVFERSRDAAGSQGTRKAVPDTPLGRLMTRPWPRHGRVRMWNWCSSTKDLFGEWALLKIRNPQTNLPVALFPLHPTIFDVRREGGELRYVLRHRRPDGEELAFGEADVIHSQRYNPASALRGLSRLEPLRRALLSEDAVQQAQENFYRGGARPSVLITHPKEMSPGAAGRLKASWEQLHAGASNWGKTAVLEEGADVKVIQLSNAEMQMIEQRKIAREEACALYDCPPPVVQLLDRATFSNITEQMKSLYRETMTPRLGEDEDVLANQLTSEFSDRQHISFVLDEVLRGDPEQRSVSQQRQIYSAVRTPNEVRALENLGPLPGGDVLYISSAMIPLETAGDLEAARERNGGIGRPASGTGASAGTSTRGLRMAAARLAAAAKTGEGLAGVDIGVLTAGLDNSATSLVGAHLAMAINRGDDLSGLRAAIGDEVRAATEAGFDVGVDPTTGLLTDPDAERHDQEVPA